MILNLFNKNNNLMKKMRFNKNGCLLIHAAKIDENYSEKEKK